MPPVLVAGVQVSEDVGVGHVGDERATDRHVHAQGHVVRRAKGAHRDRETRRGGGR